MKSVFILIPAEIPTGPVKGAIALANALAVHCKVTLVSLKHGEGANTPFDERVSKICLGTPGRSMWQKIKEYKKIINQNKSNKTETGSVSFCLSADFVNLFCKKIAITCSSVRGNLFVNYKHDYGSKGLLLAFLHLFSLRGMHHVVAMNQAMRDQVQKFSGKKTSIIENFIDENGLSHITRIPQKTDILRLVFVGSLSTRKHPLLIVQAVAQLKKMGVKAQIEFIGDGPLRDDIEKRAKDLGLNNEVMIHGFMPNPEQIVHQSDVFVLPSLSEGVSRAAMEALFLGVPCVLRNVDGNSELINQKTNGILFDNDKDLAQCILEASKINNRDTNRPNLLPDRFHQQNAALRYLNLLDQTYGR